MHQLNDEAVISDRPIEEYTNEELLDLIVKNVCTCPECVEHHDEHCCCHEHGHEHHHHHHHHHHDGDEVFDSFAFTSEHLYTKEELEEVFKDLDESILRIKGYVKGVNTTWYFNYILNEYHIFEGEHQDEALIVVIGTKLDEEKIKELFK